MLTIVCLPNPRNSGSWHFLPTFVRGEGQAKEVLLGAAQRPDAAEDADRALEVLDGVVELLPA